MPKETKKRKKSESKDSPFSERLGECFSLFKSLHEEIEERIEFLQQKEEQRKKQIEESFEKLKSQINLNVGGQRFSTSKSTLTSIEDTYFYAMLSSDKWKPNEYGEYFIDRNPKHFQQIVDYMKDGRLFNDLNSQEKREIKKEMDYYQIPIPESLMYEKWHWDPKKKGKYITLTDNNMTATSSDKRISNVIGNKTVDRFRIKILSNDETDCQSYVGLAPDQEFNLRGFSEESWSIGLRDGVFCNNGKYNQDSIYNFKVGDEIELYHNQEEGTIRLYINKEDKGIISDKVPKDIELYPLFEGNDSQDSVEILF
eukprot:TRINITY_DN8184_c0_g2_i2.p1 TRINITY_DN8184_c0_g2~~TRINITY_DN8184_c0_g2_i2.p1  ORF type:complete len:312 (-),score=78.33 TRINITY_DN8184_c0_g2_i2:3-938(-)